MENALYILQCQKAPLGQSDIEQQKIKPVAIVIDELCLSEGNKKNSVE